MNQAEHFKLVQGLHTYNSKTAFGKKIDNILKDILPKGLIVELLGYARKDQRVIQFNLISIDLKFSAISLLGWEIQSNLLHVFTNVNDIYDVMAQIVNNPEVIARIEVYKEHKKLLDNKMKELENKEKYQAKNKAGQFGSRYKYKRI